MALDSQQRRKQRPEQRKQLWTPEVARACALRQHSALLRFRAFRTIYLGRFYG